MDIQVCNVSFAFIDSYSNEVIGVDVNIYASSPKDAWALQGNHENTEVGEFIADYLDLDLKEITNRLQASESWSAPGDSDPHEPYHWMGHPLNENVRTEGLDTYHGAFRKRSECACGSDH